MKRIDLHIHTVASPLDEDFEFDLDVLLNRIKDNCLDAIALTNHNLFDSDNYHQVCNAVPANVCVFPGIEVSVENFHVLVIADPARIDEFSSACLNVPEIQQGDNGITVNDFLQLFGDGTYIVIPHFKKKPAISSAGLTALGGIVTALEVSSDKKWYCENKSAEKPVVIFSDCRCGKGAIAPWGRYTYVGIGEMNFDSLRLAFRDKDKFSITEREDHIELSPGLYVASGLNVVVGSRSSGKSYLLDRVYESSDPDDVVYVRQFDIVKNAEEKAFREKLADEEASIKADYYKPMNGISSALLNLPSKETINKRIKEYISNLILYADSAAREDEFSKCPIYSAGKIAQDNANKEQEVAQALITLLNENPLSIEISERIGRATLVFLLKIAIDLYKAKALRCKCIDYANKISKKIKAELSLESSRPACPESPFAEAAKRKAYVIRLAKLRGATKSEVEISRRKIGKFSRITKRIPYGNAKTLKTAIEARTSLTGITKLDDVEYVEKILDADGVSDISRALFDINVVLENERGENVSGGQKAEYLFFQALDKAASQDIVLIDEPESSFDNPFLNALIATEIKRISSKATVFLATHNNVLGVSIKPDGIIYTGFENGVHRIYTCDSSDSCMRSSDGHMVERSEVLLKLMEAGGTAYDERKPYYGLVGN